MKVGYVAFLPHASSSVEHGIYERARAAERLGNKDLQFVIIGELSAECGDLPSNMHRTRMPRTILSYTFAQLCRYRVIERAVGGFNFDMIVLRYAGADFSAKSYFGRTAVVTEHHTNELEEGKATLLHKRGWGRQIKRLRYQLERRFGGPVRSTAKGIIGVTEELRQLELGRSTCVPPSTVIPNGIDAGRVVQTCFAPFDGRVLHLVFVASAVSLRNAPWHGLDRVVEGIRRYTGTVRIQLHIVGRPDREFVDYVAPMRPSVILHGEKYGGELDDLMAGMNLGLSTLALYRKQMQQACSLKTREYMARGLPFVLGYDDPDLSHTAWNSGFFWKVPNDGRPINIDELVRFAANVSRRAETSTTMRNIAFDHMDWTAKMAQMYTFVCGIGKRLSPASVKRHQEQGVPAKSFD